MRDSPRDPGIVVLPCERNYTPDRQDWEPAGHSSHRGAAIWGPNAKESLMRRCALTIRFVTLPVPKKLRQTVSAVGRQDAGMPRSG